MSELDDLKREAFKNPEVKSEYDKLGMTLTEYKEHHRLRWHDVARKLTEQGNGPVFEGRLNRLRSGKTPTLEEKAALYQLTEGEVNSYKD